MDVRVGLWRKLSAEKLILFNCGVGEDSWESLGLQRDSTNPSWRRSVLGVHWKDWCWSWNSNTLATSCEELTHWKRLWCWEGLGAGGEGATEDEMAGWHHQLDGHKFEWTPGAGDGQGGLECCDSWGCRELDRMSDWTDLNWFLFLVEPHSLFQRFCPYSFLSRIKEVEHSRPYKSSFYLTSNPQFPH